MDNVIRGVIHLALHLNRLLLVLCHFDTQDPKVGPSKVQSNEVPLFCQNENADKLYFTNALYSAFLVFATTQNSFKLHRIPPLHIH